MNMSGESIGPVDLAWLRMDRPTNPMVIVAVLILSEPLSLARLKDLLGQRLLSFERFLDRPVSDALGERWQRDEHFKLDAHLRRLKLPPRAGDAQLQAAASRLASTPLDRTRPLWQFHLVERFGKGSAIIGRVHHCYADGVALMRVLLSLTGADSPALTTRSDGADHAGQGLLSLLSPLTEVLSAAGGLAQRAVETTAGVINSSLQALAHPTQAAALVQRVADATRELAKIALLPPDPPTPLKGELGQRKQVCWAEPLSFQEVRTVAHALGVSINDVLLSSVAGALGAYLETRETNIDSMTLRALVPVNLRPAGQTPRLGNEFGLVFASLPVGERHPLARLYAVHRDMEQLKHSSQAMVAFWLLTAMGLLPDVVEHEAIELFTTKASAVISNVPGPREPLYVAGARIERQFFWVPQAGSIGLGVSLLTYGGAVHFGVMTDRHLIAHPEQITARFAREFERLLLHVVAGALTVGTDRAATTPQSPVEFRYTSGRADTRTLDHVACSAARASHFNDLSGGLNMATRKKSKSKRASAQPGGPLANVIDIGQQIWLAGLGAVARAQQEGPKVFEALVSEGSEFQQHQREMVQDRASDLWNELRSQLDNRTAGVRGRATETMDNLEGILQTRVMKALQQLGVPTSQEIDALSRKVKELNRSVQELTQARSGNAGGRKRAASTSASASQQGAAV